MGRVDPHLIQGCEVMPDIDEPLFEELYSVQKAFIRRILGVHKKSLLAPLHTETGLVPLKYRRLELVFRYLDYLQQRPADTYAAAAFAEAQSLAQDGHKGWLMDILYVAQDIGLGVALAELINPTAEMVAALQTRLRSHLTLSLQDAISSSRKAYLLHDRLEPQQQGTCKREIMCLRHYLHVPNASHRRALSRILMGCHLLAVERLAWRERYRDAVPHDQRLCRFCHSAVETPEHAMLRCAGLPELLQARTRYLSRIYAERPSLPKASTVQDPAAYVRLLICDIGTIGLTARFAHDVLKLYAEEPMYIPPPAYVRNNE